MFISTQTYIVANKTPTRFVNGKKVTSTKMYGRIEVNVHVVALDACKLLASRLWCLNLEEVLPVQPRSKLANFRTQEAHIIRKDPPEDLQ